MKKNSKFKYIFLLFMLLILFIFICADYYVSAISTDISKSIFRLHVIANSDSETDQDLKYLVRDAVLDYVNDISQGVSSKEEIISIVNSNVDNIKQIALSTIKDAGYDYDVNLSIGNFDFPTKSYGDISFPAGFYDALRIEIGNASGQNWWCVMFPPLCFVDVSSGIVPDESKAIIEENLSEEEFSIISDDSSILKFKFKIVEFFQNLKIETAKK